MFDGFPVLVCVVLLCQGSPQVVRIRTGEVDLATTFLLPVFVVDEEARLNFAQFTRLGSVQGCLEIGALRCADCVRARILVGIALLWLHSLTETLRVLCRSILLKEPWRLVALGLARRLRR